MRIDLFVRRGSSKSIFLRPFPNVAFEVPGALIDAVAGQLCSSLLLVRTTHRTVMGPDARPWLNSLAPLLANLTTLELLTVCRDVLVQVRTVSLPTIIALAVLLMMTRGLVLSFYDM
jgi:hypothetical protein